MRKFLTLFVIGIFAAMVWSCDDDDNNDKVISTDALPVNVRSFIESYFPGDKIVRAERDGNHADAEYEVKLASGFDVEFDASGSWIDVDAPTGVEITGTGFIPKPIVDYVTQNYTYGINEISKERYEYDVELTNGLDLIFDTDGNFVRIDR